MDILNEALEFVNKQIAFHKTKAEEFAPSNSRRAQHHAKTADGMTEVANLLTKQSVDIKGLEVELAKRPPAPDRAKRPLQLRIEDLDGLPDELIQEAGLRVLGSTRAGRLITLSSLMPPALRHACGRRAGGRRLSCRQGP